MSRTEIGLGLTLSDDNEVLAIDPEGGAARATVPLAPSNDTLRSAHHRSECVASA